MSWTLNLGVYMTNEIEKIEKKTATSRVSGATLATVFAIAVGISAAVYFVISLILGKEHFTDAFFIGGRDFFMDCFNSIRDAAQGSGVYSERGVIYPPMANLIFLIMSYFTPNEYNSTSFDARYEWTQYVPCLILVFITAAVCFVLLYSLVERFLGGKKTIVTSAALMLSVPMLYLIERGNILVFCLAALLVYAITFNSESKWKREVGLIALAFAFSVKLYPVVFGWLLITNKRYRDAIRCAIYGILMLVLPSFFFGGPIFTAKHLINNIFNFSTGTGNEVSQLMNYLDVSPTLQGAANALIYLWVLVCAASFVVSSFVNKKDVQRLWILGVATILCVPSLTGIYNWIFLTIPLIMIFNKERPSKRDIAYFIIIALPYLFLPFRINARFGTTDVLIYATTAALSIFAVVDTVMDAIKTISAKKRVK